LNTMRRGIWQLRLCGCRKTDPNAYAQGEPNMHTLDASRTAPHQSHGHIWFVPNCVTLCLVRIEELTLNRKVRQSVVS
jgi:hypothetical protein